VSPEERIPQAWADFAIAWAQRNPEVHEVWLYGSRVTGRSRKGGPCRPDSDLDVALVISGDDEHQRLGNEITLCPRLANDLGRVIGVPAHVEALREDHHIVGPEVRVHGRLIYQQKRNHQPPEGN
jgi:predicted nucleotidyltransferase